MPEFLVPPTGQRPADLTRKQIAWCDKFLGNFQAMRMQAEKARAHATDAPAKPLYGN